MSSAPPLRVASTVAVALGSLLAGMVLGDMATKQQEQQESSDPSQTREPAPPHEGPWITGAHPQPAQLLQGAAVAAAGGAVHAPPRRGLAGGGGDVCGICGYALGSLAGDSARRREGCRCRFHAACFAPFMGEAACPVCKASPPPAQPAAGAESTNDSEAWMERWAVAAP
jgi:hypothetical protein